MTDSFIQPLNTRVTEMTMDGLTNFQKRISGIKDIVRLTFGEPGFPVDDVVKSAIIESVTNDQSHYSVAEGDPKLRQAAVNYYNEKFNMNFEGVDNVIVTSGVSEAIYDTFQTLLDLGDGIIIPEPAYPPYFAAIELIHGKLYKVDTSQTHFKLTPEAVEHVMSTTSQPIKAVLFNYPSNPTGVTYSKDELVALAAVFKKYKLWVISDEIYAELTYDMPHVSMVTLLPEQTILITGLSKSHAMTGYRIGFIMASKAFITEAAKVHDTITFSLPKITQDGATAALTLAKDAPLAMRHIYRQRRDFVVTAMTEMGFDIVDPQGAFYIFARIPADFNAGEDGLNFAWQLANEGGVGVTPGISFSQHTRDYIRVSYAADDEVLTEAMQRMHDWITDIRDKK
ncbi:aminotransferase class I/II-fold pyridoxal phosphate-dependent enzyme [Weissella diestrammenae]|uniref:Aminotransferase n=1 Tax=Weissella diestrammenae TaxID=1162633 RepID=A0A7G9T683_9LACO|nr:aminotransferase class I/II-fold pyridoxal phosphate-dependent enzyme [Weissella diestrammenae]MCM0583348.1 aminotransferase class I/II-fold pyridoxal phosphate-dependent enzyme [Weissella diestrammenae]QNN75608.1 aminotransferase class I/II-fold pyridoxal phosphate-dependent enzyme [Weissella diestrammenae]